MAEVTCVDQAGAVLGEGPLWDDERGLLWWVDIKGKRLHRHDPLTGGNHAQHLEHRLSAIGLTQAGSFVGCGDLGFVHLAVHPTTRLVSIEAVIASPDEPRGNRFNDGKVDPQGRFWAGSMDDAEEQARGILYCLAPDLPPHAVKRDIKVPNGPAFAADGTMYFTDSARRRITRLSVDADGALCDERTFATFTEGQGYPDGSTVDQEGCLWVAFWDGWCVRRLDASGNIDVEVRVPVRRPTSCAFGGRELDTLYITTASIGLDEQPLAGALFAVKVGVKGLRTNRFGGAT